MNYLLVITSTIANFWNNLGRSTKKQALKVGDKGRCVNSITPTKANSVFIHGEEYTAMSGEFIPAYAYIEVVTVEPLIVSEIYKGEIY